MADNNIRKGGFLQNNWFFFTMILGIVLGIAVGFAWPGAGALEPLGTLFINMMFCVVVPMVFFSISSSIANMKSARRAGKLMGTTVLTFMCTTIIASVIMYVVVLLTNGVYTGKALYSAESGSKMGLGELIVLYVIGFPLMRYLPTLTSFRDFVNKVNAK